MPTTFRPYSPDQLFLLPPSPREWLPEGHLVCFISETVDALDLSELYRPYEGDGRRNQPFDPRMLVKVLLYAYATGTSSSRRIARRIEEDVAYRVDLGHGPRRVGLYRSNSEAHSAGTEGADDLVRT